MSREAEVLVNIKEFILGSDPFTTASVHMVAYLLKDNQGNQYINSDVEIRDCNRKISLHEDNIYKKEDLDRQIRKLNHLQYFLGQYISQLELIDFAPTKQTTSD